MGQLRGFDVDMRALALRGLSYSVRVLPTYGELQVRTRNGECDVGWAQFFQTASRERCEVGTQECQAITELDPNAGPQTAISAPGATWETWEPYRCCARYGPNLFPFTIHIMYRTDTQ